MRLSIRRWGVAAAVGLLVTLWAYSDVSEANHFRWLPGLCGQDVMTCPTPVMQKAQTRGYVTYSFDTQAGAYPNFKAQAAQVAAAGFWGIGLEGREVASGADIILTMPDDATFINVCGRAAAGCITYWSDPIIIYFRKALLYTDYKTVIGHEGLNYGHAQGQHERYFDNGEFRCDTTARYTVMSCGTGVWEPQPFDVETVCAALKTAWCGQAPDPCSPQCWDGDSWEFNPPYLGYLKSLTLDTPDGRWWDVNGRLAWDDVDPSWNGRWMNLMECWVGDESLLCQGDWIPGKVVKP